MRTTHNATLSVQARLWLAEDSLLRAALLHDLRALADSHAAGSHAGFDLADTCREVALRLREVRYQVNREHGL